MCFFRASIKHACLPPALLLGYSCWKDYYRRLIYYYVVVMYNEGVSSTQVYSYFLCEKIEQSHYICIPGCDIYKITVNFT